MIKKTITLCVLSSLIASYCFASDINQSNNQEKNINSNNNNVVIEVDKCPPIVKLTEQEVKMINKDLFLDSDGNKVNPCKINKEVSFFIVTKYENGINIYNESKNKVLNKKQVYNEQMEKNINLNFDKTKYKITYGSNNYELEDLNDFQKNINKEDLNKTVSENTAIKSMLSQDKLEKLKSTIEIKKVDSLDDKFNNYIDKEKETTIHDDLNEILNFIHQNETTELKRFNDKFKDLSLNQNRLILENNNVVNQYLIPTKDKEIINGNSFYLFALSKSGYDYYLAYEDKLRDFIVDNTVSLNVKLATLESLKSNTKDISASAENIYNESMNKWSNSSLKQKEAITLGINEYKTSTNDTKQLYNDLIKDVNEKIIHNEIEILPNKISKKQYSLLSNINKYKYIPEREKNYTSKNIFVKNDTEKILKTKY